MTTNPDSNPDLLWGAKAIARYINLSERAVFHMLDAGHLKPAKKLGGRWYADKADLLAFLRSAPSTEV